MKLLITIPTYNEAENIESFIKAVFDNAPHEADVLVIDDNSPDGTSKIVERLIPGYPQRLCILNRAEKQGLARAYLAAFEWGLSRNYDAFLEMDADFSHKPLYISEMFKEIQTHDAVIGSRNIKGGCVEGWSAFRNFISKGGSFYSGAVLDCPIKDLTGGFNMWTKGALLIIALDKIISTGYLFQVEMKYRAWRAGCSIKEIPIVFTDRKFGKSKMSKKIFFEALLGIWKIKQSIDTGSSSVTQFMKFCITGGLGTVTNLLIFFICVDKLKLPEVPVSILCFFIAGTQNYIINHNWSFARNTQKTRLSIQKWLMFLCASLLGLAVNIAVMKLVILNFTLPYKFIAQACGIASGMTINFFVSKLLVFRRTEC
jgi:dolichol-phosphate mannosyltransferase